MLKNEYPEFNRYKNLSTKELKELLNNLDASGVPFKKGTLRRERGQRGPEADVH